MKLFWFFSQESFCEGGIFPSYGVIRRTEELWKITFPQVFRGEGALAVCLSSQYVILLAVQLFSVAPVALWTPLRRYIELTLCLYACVISVEATFPSTHPSQYLARTLWYPPYFSRVLFIIVWINPETRDLL